MEDAQINEFIKKHKKKKIVAIQGLGFVGSAMLTAVASAKDEHGLRLYAAIGVDLPATSSYWKIGAINNGKFPIRSSDKHLLNTFKKCYRAGNIMATADKRAYQLADIVIVDINLDGEKSKIGKAKLTKVAIDDFVFSMREIAKNIKPSSLVIVESTVPPGICEKVLAPLFRSEFKKRGHRNPKINLAYSYERVMPGKDYLKSITSYYRVFSATSSDSKKRTRRFFETVIDTKSFPLTELDSMTAAEMGKVLENSYRATNIAFIQEWTRFAELAGVNLFEVIEGIKKRPTHNNIMLPGFGVGGYCLPKDPLLADWALTNLFKDKNRLHMSLEAVSINDKMPFYSFSLLKKYFRKLRGKRILLMGVSYLSDIADTRRSPSELFYKACAKGGALVLAHDPIVRHWPELNLNVMQDLKPIEKDKVDAIVFAVAHERYKKMDIKKIEGLVKNKGLILDCNNVLSERKAGLLRKAGFRVAGVGKGQWNKVLTYSG